MASVWLPPSLEDQHFPHLRGVSKNGQVLSIPRVKVIQGSPSSPVLVPYFLPPSTGEDAVFSSGDDMVATIHTVTGEITPAPGAEGGDEVTITVRRGGDSIYSSVTGSRVLQVTMVQTITISEGSTEISEGSHALQGFWRSAIYAECCRHIWSFRLYMVEFEFGGCDSDGGEYGDAYGYVGGIGHDDPYGAGAG